LTTEAKHRRRHRLGIALACVSVLLLLAVGALWFALQEKKQADKAAARARTEEDRSWIEGAKLNSARGDHFAAALMAARALEFAGYGREKIVDPQFKEEYPVLLIPVADPLEEQEARRQINEAALAGYFGLPLWQTPMYRQDEGPVLSVAWSPDGKFLASGANDQTVKLRDGAVGKLRASLQGYTGDVYSVAWSPDGKTLVTGSDDQTVKLWDAATGKLGVWGATEHNAELGITVRCSPNPIFLGRQRRPQPLVLALPAKKPSVAVLGVWTRGLVDQKEPAIADDTTDFAHQGQLRRSEEVM
jgi:hypothetical protein